VILGALVLGEPFGLRIVLASSLVLAGLALVRVTSARRTRATAERTRPQADSRIG